MCLNKFPIILTLHNTLILPYLSYCNVVWANTYKSKLQPIFILQKRIVRICSFSSRLAHTSELFIQLNILTIFQLNSYFMAILLFKHKLNLLHSSLSSMFAVNSSIHPYNTRNRNNYHLWPANKNYLLFSFRHRAPLIWNTLPHEIKSIVFLNTFKRKLKTFLILCE